MHPKAWEAPQASSTESLWADAFKPRRDGRGLDNDFSESKPKSLTILKVGAQGSVHENGLFLFSSAISIPGGYYHSRRQINGVMAEREKKRVDSHF